MSRVGMGRSGRHRVLSRVNALVAVVAVLVSATVLPVLGPRPTAHAAPSNQVLILGATITGGTSSLEAQEVAALGYTPVIVDDPTWEAMTTAQFASYHAIVIGDPTCGSYEDTSHLTAALSNPTTWGAAITGNTLIIGTDPVFHSGGVLSSGPGQLVQHGIDFALAQPGKTGAYIDLSCAYGVDPANTPLPLLDGISPGGFTVDGGPSSVCYNEAHIVAVSPALGGLTDADLSNWSCSVHEAFDKWPGNFIPLAIARDFNSTFTASDGTIGPPYILASGSIVSFPLSLSPLTASGTVGTSHTVTAQLLSGSAGNPPVAGARIGFRVSSGPNAGASGLCSSGSVCSTDSAGHVSWTYHSNGKVGDDTIQTFYDLNGNGIADPGEPITSAGMHWVQQPRTVMFVHGIRGDWRKIVQGTDWAKLTGPIKTSGMSVRVFEYYQDLGDHTATGTCNNRSPDTMVGTLYLNPKAVNPNICDTNSDLAINAALLDDDLQTATGTPTTIISNSLGGAITRGWLDLAQQRHSTTGSVDSVIFIQGGQQGSWLAGAGVQLDHRLPSWLKGRFVQLTNSLNLNVQRPGVKDVAPQSKWYSSVNPAAVPHIHYYNFISDLQVTFQYHLLFYTYTIGTANLGDLVFLPGTDNPADEPPNGGARFLPYGSAPGQHEYIIVHNYTADTVLGATVLPAVLASDPVNHLNFGNNLDSINVPACDGSQSSISVANEIVRILAKPAGAC